MAGGRVVLPSTMLRQRGRAYTSVLGTPDYVTESPVTQPPRNSAIILLIGAYAIKEKTVSFTSIYERSAGAGIIRDARNALGDESAERIWIGTVDLLEEHQSKSSSGYGYVCFVRGLLVYLAQRPVKIVAAEVPSREIQTHPGKNRYKTIIIASFVFNLSRSLQGRVYGKA